MLSRFAARHLRHLRFRSPDPSLSNPLFSTPLRPLPPPAVILSGHLNHDSILSGHRSRTLSSNTGGSGRDRDDGKWKLTPEADEPDALFGEGDASLSELSGGIDDAFSHDPDVGAGDGPMAKTVDHLHRERDIFEDIEQEVKKGSAAIAEKDEEWETAAGYKPWSFEDGDEKGKDILDVSEEGGLEGIGGGGFEEVDENAEEKLRLEKKEEELLGTLKGPNRAFGDLIAASGITEDMIYSLILLKDVRHVKGLPPLREIEDKAIARLSATNSRAEIERKKQEEISKSRVRTVDAKGRAYGTGRRKCSIARVWIQPGDGKFVINEKQFDAYFPIIDHRAVLLGPFTATKTLGLWDVNCTVKGGGVSGQVGAVRLGISRALQNFEPGLRSLLKPAGYLTRDPRVVERKKPGKAKARKSFQWVKR